MTSVRSRYRQSIRHLALNGLAQWDQWVRSDDRLRATQAVQVLLLHDVRSCDETPFVEFLRWLKSVYSVVSYSRAVELIQTGSIDGPYLAISFDDGLRSHLRAAQLMRDEGISGCFFLSPRIIGNRSPEFVERYCRERMLFDRIEEFLTWDDVGGLLDLGQEVGNHTMGHFYLHELNADRFAEELRRGRDELVERLGDIKHFAWPYGRFRHLTADGFAKVFEMGHASCASGERGSHARHSVNNPVVCVRRESIDLAWPKSHVRYFLSRGLRNPLRPDQTWTAGCFARGPVAG